MAKGVNVELTIRDNKTGRYLLIPVVPPLLQYQDGNAQADTVQILNLGAVDFPAGVELDTLSWASFFPARYDPAYCATADLLEPLSYRNQFSGWKDNHTPLQIICPAAGLNKTVTLANFSWDFGKGFEGDIYYQVTFREVKTLRPKKLTPQGTVPPKGKLQTEERKPAPEKATPQNYTVKGGDTLTLIGKKVGVNWRTGLYDPNKPLIGPDPGKIFPGQELKVVKA